MDQRLREGGAMRQSYSGAAGFRSGGVGRRIPSRDSDDSPHVLVMVLRLLVLYSILSSALWVFLTSP
jgi:hypothetical protein